MSLVLGGRSTCTRLQEAFRGVFTVKMENFLSYEERKPLSYAMMKKHAPPWCAVRLYDGLSKYPVSNPPQDPSLA